MAKTHFSWRTRKVQTFQSFGCGQTHEIIFVGNCESCGRSVYAVNSPFCSCDDKPQDDPDPRGAIPPTHCVDRKHAKEHGYIGRTLVACAACMEIGDKYRALLAAAKSNGTWIEDTDDNKRDIYRRGGYSFRVPPVCTANWDEEAWIKYIDLGGGIWQPEKATPDINAQIAELTRQMEACNPQADIGTPEHTKRFALKDQIFELRKAADSWPAESCPKCNQHYYACPTCGRSTRSEAAAAKPCTCGGTFEPKHSVICCKRDWHHLGDCCLHCGNDERKQR